MQVLQPKGWRRGSLSYILHEAFQFNISSRHKELMIVLEVKSSLYQTESVLNKTTLPVCTGVSVFAVTDNNQSSETFPENSLQRYSTTGSAQLYTAFKLPGEVFGDRFFHHTKHYLN